MGKKILFGLAITVLVGFILLIVFGLWAESAANNVYVTINMPSEVTTQEAFEIEVVLENLLDEKQTLDSIDIGDSYLEGFSLLGADPEYTQTFHIPIDNTVSHTFQQSIPAAGSLTVTFDLAALSVGQYRGDFDVCINSGSTCQFLSIATEVTELE